MFKRGVQESRPVRIPRKIGVGLAKQHLALLKKWVAFSDPNTTGALEEGAADANLNSEESVKYGDTA